MAGQYSFNKYFARCFYPTTVKWVLCTKSIRMTGFLILEKAPWQLHIKRSYLLRSIGFDGKLDSFSQENEDRVFSLKSLAKSVITLFISGTTELKPILCDIWSVHCHALKIEWLPVAWSWCEGIKKCVSNRMDFSIGVSFVIKGKKLH